MRAKQKANLIARILSGESRCDCDLVATRFDEAGKPECQRCHDLNEKAKEFHERTQKAMAKLSWEMNWA